MRQSFSLFEENLDLYSGKRNNVRDVTRCGDAAISWSLAGDSNMIRLVVSMIVLRCSGMLKRTKFKLDADTFYRSVWAN